LFGYPHHAGQNIGFFLKTSIFRIGVDHAAIINVQEYLVLWLAKSLRIMRLLVQDGDEKNSCQ